MKEARPEDTLMLLALDRAARAAQRGTRHARGLEAARDALTEAARAESRAREAAHRAGVELDALLAGVAEGRPPRAEQFQEVAARHLEACAFERSACAGADRARKNAADVLATTARSRAVAPASSRRAPRSVRGREPVTQRSPRLSTVPGAIAEPLSQRPSAPPS
ncbi:MAG: hypothetical protein JNL21_08715 [Myxococcales bacterium]|nr:hypothetical protein [Myxococcales bacterium]